MEVYDIYKDITERTNGDIYVGVVGPVRTGKSLFVKRFMEALVIPNITDKTVKERAIDELPQSGDGKMIMTTQPRFVPEKGIKVSVGEKVEANFRLVDCVGYMISGASGATENGKSRMVKTPWNERDIPFEEAAEIGTDKVINDYSTFGVVLTSDGTVTEIQRGNYIPAEERAVQNLKERGKPFIIVLNSKNPQDEQTQKMRMALEEKYKVPVITINVDKMSVEDVNGILEKVLMQFPVRCIELELDDWVRALPFDNWVIKKIADSLKNYTSDVDKMRDYKKVEDNWGECDDFNGLTTSCIRLGEGKMVYKLGAKQALYYKVLSEECGCEIKDDSHLIAYIKHLTYAKERYDKMKMALSAVEHVGYGVVAPLREEMELGQPEIVKQGSKFGVRVTAKAPSLHIMRVDVDTEVCPIVGTQEQSEELINYMLADVEKNPNSIWQTNMFGKTLDDVIADGINSKIYAMPEEVKEKMRKTLGRIVNEGKGGVLCILL